MTAGGNLPPDQDSIGWFAPPDLDLLFKAISKINNPENVVLVGGQSLSFWVDRYDIPIPKTDTPYLTQDADFLACKEDAKAISDLIGGQIKLATLDDLTPNTATVVFTSTTGHKLLIDFLGIIVGVDNAEIRKFAVPLRLGDWHLNVLHPLLCLKSRINNLNVLPSKRNKNGIEQARVAVEVVKCYLRQRIQEGNTRGALIGVNQIAAMAQTPAGLYVWEKYGIDVLKAVEPEIVPVQQFQEIEWPRQVKLTEQRRDKIVKRKEQQEIRQQLKLHKIPYPK
jgi:hypothetical protein